MSDWKKDLKDIFEINEPKEEQDQEKLKKVNLEVSQFISKTVVPAFEEIKEEIEKNYQRKVVFGHATNSAAIRFNHYSLTEFDYSIKFKIKPNGAFPYSEQHITGTRIRISDFLRSGNQDYTTADITKDEIIRHIILKYKNSRQHLIQRSRETDGRPS